MSVCHVPLNVPSVNENRESERTAKSVEKTKVRFRTGRKLAIQEQLALEKKSEKDVKQNSKARNICLFKVYDFCMKPLPSKETLRGLTKMK